MCSTTIEFFKQSFYTTHRLQDDADIVRTAVANKAKALQFASPAFETTPILCARL